MGSWVGEQVCHGTNVDTATVSLCERADHIDPNQIPRSLSPDGVQLRSDGLDTCRVLALRTLFNLKIQSIIKNLNVDFSCASTNVFP